jgi:pyrroline-5-carboxylate reductase
MKYGFIGCGNMGGAIAQALAKKTKDILLSDRSGKGKVLAQELGCKYADPATVAAECEYIFLGVKPQGMESVLQSLKDTLQAKKPVLISMAAGLQLARIQEMLGFTIPMIRIMPNTPVAVGCGMTPYCHNALVTDVQMTDFLADMAMAGSFDELPEELFDVATALSGSGPAYLYLFAEALADGAAACGLPKEKALQYAANTMAGAARMMQTSPKSPAELKEAVCSPGGSTIRGVDALEKAGIRTASADCILAAYNRNIELGK